MIYKKSKLSFEEVRQEMKKLINDHPQLFIDFFSPYIEQTPFNNCPYKTSYNLGRQEFVKKLLRHIE